MAGRPTRAVLLALLCFGCDDTGGEAPPDPDVGRASLGDATPDARPSDDGVPFLDVGVDPDGAPTPDATTTDEGLLADGAVQADAADPFDPVDEVIIVGGAPADAPERFASAPEAEGCAPRLVYPEPLTVFPRNMSGLRFQWDEDGHDLFALEITAGPLTMRWFTAEAHVTPDGDPWEALLRTAAGQALEVRLVGLGGAGDQACPTPRTTVFVDTSSLEGAVYYWSTGDIGIMRLAQGEAAPEPFLTPGTAPEINCPACHALSRDGTRIAFTRTSFPPFGDMATSNTADPRRLLYDPAGVAGYFPSFAPDSRHIVAGAGGRLVIRSADTGEEESALALPPNTVGGSPDWSWQGDRIVAALGQTGLFNPIPDVGISGGGLYQWELGEDGAWGDPAELVPIAGNGELSNDRPAYSPNGAVIAYERRGADPNEDTQGNDTAELWILHSAGGQPTPLTAANQGPGLGNSWPKWAVTDNRGKLWVAFSSLRPYGRVTNGGNPQIWVAAIERDTPAGQDPSSPAFWLPYQNPESGNHIPYWSAYHKE